MEELEGVVGGASSCERRGTEPNLDLIGDDLASRWSKTA